MQKEVLLKVDELRTEFFSSKKSSVTAVDKVSFDIYKGEILGLVGESGCGKSVTSLSIMRLLKDTPGKVTHGHAILDGMDLLAASDAEIRAIRGGRMSMSPPSAGQCAWRGSGRSWAPGRSCSSGRPGWRGSPRPRPGLVIFVTVLAFNLFGDGLRDTLDPKIK